MLLESIGNGVNMERKCVGCGRSGRSLEWNEWEWK